MVYPIGKPRRLTPAAPADKPIEAQQRRSPKHHKARRIAAGAEKPMTARSS